jgi:hypothetical protein
MWFVGWNMLTHVCILSAHHVFALCPDYLATSLNQVCHLPTESLRSDDTLNPLLSYTDSQHSSYHVDCVSSPPKLAQQHLCLRHCLNTKCLRNRGSDEYFDVHNDSIHCNQNCMHGEIEIMLNPIQFGIIWLYICYLWRWRLDYGTQCFSLHLELCLRH